MGKQEGTWHKTWHRLVEKWLPDYDWVLDLDIKGFFGAPGKAWRFQRVKFPPQEGVKPHHCESSLGPVRQRSVAAPMDHPPDGSEVSQA